MEKNPDILSENIKVNSSVINTGNPIRRFSDVMKTDYSGIQLGEISDKPKFGDQKVETIGNVIFAPADAIGGTISSFSGGSFEKGVEYTKNLRDYTWDTTVKSSSIMINDTYWGANGLVYGRIPQAIGNLTGDTDLVEGASLVRDYTEHRIKNYADKMAETYNTKPKNIADQVVGGITSAAIQITPALIGGVSGGTTVAKLFGSDAMFSYLNKQDEKYDNTNEQTAGQIGKDIAWAGLVGTATYSIDKFTGGLPIAEKLFAKGSKDLLIKSGEKVVKSALEEGFGEVAQNILPDIADKFRGRESNKELFDATFNKENLVTFISAGILGGTLGGAEYFSARSEMQGQIKDNLRNRFGITDEKILESTSGKLMTGAEDILADVRKDILVDDQLKNKYGTIHNTINLRIESLINQSIENGQMPDIDKFDSITQAQLQGSISQRFTDELFAQSALRGVPVSEVFNESKIDVENGVMYMYGESYGKRPLSRFGKVTPEEYAQQETIANKDMGARNITFPQKVAGKGTIAGFNPLKGAITLKQGWNETSISKGMSQFWLDNMRKFALSAVGKDTQFGKIWSNIKTFLDIDDRQRIITPAQAEKFSSAYLDYIRTNEIPNSIDIGFKSMDSWLANIADEYFENYASEYKEIEKSTPEMVDVFQKITTSDLSNIKKDIETKIKQQEETKIIIKEQKETIKSLEQDVIEQGLPKEAANVKYQTPTTIQEYSKGEGEEFIRAGTKSAIKESIAKGVELDLSEFSNESLDKVRDSKKAAEVAADFVIENPELALDILNYNAEIPFGMLQNEILMAMRHKAILDNDLDLLYNVSNSKVAMNITEQARNLQALGINRFDRNFDPMRAIMAIESTKIKSIGADTLFNNTLSEIQKEIDLSMNESDFNNLIELLRC